MAEKRKTYTAECKQEAVRLVTEHHYGMAEAARNLDLHALSLIKPCHDLRYISG